MTAPRPVLLFVLVCALLALLRIADVIPSVAAGILFAVALATFGILSRGLRGSDR